MEINKVPLGSASDTNHTAHVLLEINEVLRGFASNRHVALALWLHAYIQDLQNYFRE